MKKFIEEYGFAILAAIIIIILIMMATPIGSNVRIEISRFINKLCENTSSQKKNERLVSVELSADPNLTITSTSSTDKFDYIIHYQEDGIDKKTEPLPYEEGLVMPNCDENSYAQAEAIDRGTGESFFSNTIKIPLRGFPNSKTYELVSSNIVRSRMYEINKINPIKNIEFVDTKMPTGATEIPGLDLDNDGGVVGWYTLNTDNTSNVYISTQKSGQKVIASSMESMFIFLTNVEFMDVSKLDISECGTSLALVFDQTGSKSSSFEIKGLETWDTSNIETPGGLFRGVGFNASKCSIGDISNWNTKNFRYATHMFNNTCHSAPKTQLDLSKWDVSNLIAVWKMITGSNFNKVRTPINVTRDTLTLDWGKNTVWYDIDDNYKEYPKCILPTGLSVSHTLVDTKPKPKTVTLSRNWEKSNFNYADITKIHFTDIKPSNPTKSWDVSEAQDGSITGYLVGTEIYLYSKDIISFPANSSRLFVGKNSYGDTFENVTEITGLNKVDTSNVVDMSDMFYNFRNLSELDVSSFDVSNVTNMKFIFFFVGMNSKKIILKGLENWNVGKVTNMQGMFYGVGSYSDEVYIQGLDKWNTCNVINMNDMFTYVGSRATKLIFSNISQWDVKNVLEIGGLDGSGSTGIFTGAGFEEIDLSGWELIKCKDASIAFSQGLIDKHKLKKVHLPKTINENMMCEWIFDNFNCFDETTGKNIGRIHKNLHLYAGHTLVIS